MINKRRVDDMIPRAYDYLQKSKIVKDGKIIKTYRSAIATFGAAVAMGSLISGTTFFYAKNENVKIDRKELANILLQLVCDKDNQGQYSDLFDYVKTRDNSQETKELIMDAAVALKLAMNLYELVDEKDEKNKDR